MFGPKEQRIQNPLAVAVGAVLVVTMLMAFVVALALVFDPRYRDFPFAPLTSAVVPFLVHRFMVARPKGIRPAAETVGAGIIGLSVAYILFNEGFANWQSLWVCAALAALSFSLAQARDAPG
jgi:glucan 1,3-beta-glucosidase